MAETIDWHENKCPGTDWLWNYNTLNWIFDIPQSAASKREYYGELAAIVDSWLKRFSGTAHTLQWPGYIWHDQGVAMRAINFCRLHKLVDADPLLFLPAFVEALRSGILEHATLLANEDFYSRHTNHGMDQAIALLWIGKTMRRDEFSALGTRRLLAEFNFAFTDEGVHKENSPAYHFYAMKRFCEAFCEHPKAFAAVREAMLAKMNDALLFLALILRPDGHWPPLGDSPDGRPGFSGATLEILQKLPNWSYLGEASGGQSVPILHKVYPRSGYAIFRDPTRELQLILKAGASSTYHYHQDEGQILLYAFGEDWFIDTGFHSYQYRDPHRIHATSRWAHNVPAAKGFPRMHDTRANFRAWRITNYSEAGVCPFVECQHECIAGVLMQRRLALGVDGVICLHDCVRGLKPEHGQLEILFHVPDDKIITVAGAEICIVSPGATLQMRVISRQFQQANVVRGMNDDITRASFISLCEAECCPTQCVHLRFAEAPVIHASFIMRLSRKEE